MEVERTLMPGRKNPRKTVLIDVVTFAENVTNRASDAPNIVAIFSLQSITASIVKRSLEEAEPLEKFAPPSRMNALTASATECGLGYDVAALFK